MLSIYGSTVTGEEKEVGKVYAWSFLWEWILSDRNKKDVKALAQSDDTEVIALTKQDIEALEKNHPEMLAKFYKHVNNITSLRLAESGRELTILYELTEKFEQFRLDTKQGIPRAICHMREVLSFDALAFIEEHPFVNGFQVYKFNSQNPDIYPINEKLEHPLREWDVWFSSGERKDLSLSHVRYIAALNTIGRTLWYIVVSSEKSISDANMRIFKHIIHSLAIMIEQSQNFADQQARSRKEVDFLRKNQYFV